MNNSNKISVQMTKSEAMTGWLYFPFYVLLLSAILTWVFDRLGLEYASAAGQARLNGLFFGINFAMCLFLFHRFLFLNLGVLGKRFWGFVQAVILGFAMYYACTFVLSKALFFFIPGMVNLNDAAILAMARESRTLILVGTVILAPVAEECMFRGLLFRSLQRKNRIAAYVISGIIFSAIHVVGYVKGNPWPVLLGCFLQYLPACVALAWTYEKADCIFAPIALHCVINAVSLGLML